MAAVRLFAIFSVAYSLIIVTKEQAPVDNEPKLALHVIGDVGGVVHHQESGQHSVGGSQDPGSGSDCIDRTGKLVPVGTDYHPYNHSPCTICECLEDKLMSSCSSTGCDALKCLNFVVDPDSCCGYTCIDNKTAASLDVRQVGADKIIVQWEMNKEYSNYTITGMKLMYSIGYGELKNWTEVLVAPVEQSAVVSRLQHGVVYTFKGVGHVDHEVYPVEIPVKPAQIILERRNGNYLKLEKQLHQKNVVIRANGNIYGEVELEDKMYINLNLFKLFKEGKTQLLGKWYRTLKLYNMQDGMKSPIDNKGDLDISVRDMKIYRWIMAHL